MRTATLAWGMVETDLHKNAVLCDGERLVMLTHRHSGVVKRTTGGLRKRNTRVDTRASVSCARSAVHS